MSKFAIVLSVLLLADADIPRAMSFHPSDGLPKASYSMEEVPLFLNAPDNDPQQSPAPAANGTKKGPLQESSKLELIRFVSGEFAKATKSLPAGKEGFLQYVQKPLNDELLQRAVATHGAAVHAGDHVQITKLEFRDHTIVVDVNGGGKGKRHLLDHLQLSGPGGAVGGPTMRTPTGPNGAEQTGPPGIQPGAGSTLFLEFPKSVPDMTPTELKEILAPFMDFSRQRSASVQWFDTLPPDLKKAIQDRTPRVGMDREMVIAAIGKPGHKVRERDNDGTEIEDWIYGTPPDRTVFVRFTGDKVTSIKQFPQ